MRGAVLALALVLAGGTARAGGADLADEGRVFAEENCARCHAVGPTGASPNPEATPFRLFQTMWPLESLEEALGEGIVVGHPDMPEFELDGRQIEALLDWLAALPPE